jgi:hypothetical protein
MLCSGPLWPASFKEDDAIVAAELTAADFALRRAQAVHPTGRQKIVHNPAGVRLRKAGFLM